MHSQCFVYYNNARAVGFYISFAKGALAALHDAARAAACSMSRKHDGHSLLFALQQHPAPASLWHVCPTGDKVWQVGCCNAFIARNLLIASMLPYAGMPVVELAAAARHVWTSQGPFVNMQGHSLDACPFLSDQSKVIAFGCKQL